MVFDDDPSGELDHLPTPTADALAALVGPCKGLTELTLPTCEPALWGCCGRTAAGGVYAPWVDEAFAGHTQLATLCIPGGDAMMPVLPRILGHLPGLVNFDLSTNEAFDPTALLTALVSHCPRLEALHLSVMCGCWEDFDPTPLGHSAQLCAQLKQLSLPEVAPSPQLEALLESLTHLERLILEQPTPALAHLAPHLTHLTVHQGSVDTLPDVGLVRLESFAIAADVTSGGPVLARLLGANRATIRSLSLCPCEPIGPLVAVLDTCPVLAELHLYLGPGSPVDLPPSLLNRLKSLHLIMNAGAPPYSRPFRIVSTSLGELDLDLCLGPDVSVTLACPALVSLTLYTNQPHSSLPLVLCCPALRRLTGLGRQGLAAECQAMPFLTQVRYTQYEGIFSPAEKTQHPPRPALAALLAGSPRLSRLSGLCFTHPEQLTELCQAAPALADLQATLAHNLSRSTSNDNRVDLRLPGHVVTIALTLTLALPDTLPKPDQTAPVSLRIEAPGLRYCTLLEDEPARAPVALCSLTLGCPVLVGLSLHSMPALATLTLDNTSMALRCLQISLCPALEPSCLLAGMQGHGGAAPLRKLVLLDAPMSCHPQLAVALSALPRLTHLELGFHPAPRLALACPALRCLRLPVSASVTARRRKDKEQQQFTTVLRSLVLDCPLLEELRGPLGTDLERFELTGGEAVYLRRVGVVSHEWAKRLEGRWPGATLVEE
ncbi:hypothetical protein PAPYR_1669 [Paratrimastix pyriformis]|uniref:Uncharacterized protein n=1 Tax=Paratrimastix pyriformis TaxID=342808 RepID=A0ABQ8US50_9EUKA|nr:hypothetical protein PAPYR_1669 [Paratrimastix pyriformis]